MAETKQENLLNGKISTEQAEIEERPKVIQLVQPKEAEIKFAEIERQYRETIERENK